MAVPMRLRFFLLCLVWALLRPGAAAEDGEHPSGGGSSSIIFASLGSRSDNAFDIFTLPFRGRSSPINELRLTDGRSLNFNGHFPSTSSSGVPLLSLLSNQTLIRTADEAPPVPPSLELIYVTERNGTWRIYYDAVYYEAERKTRSRAALETTVRVQIPLVGGAGDGVSMKDKPTLSGGHLIYVSTHEDAGEPRTSWAAVYSTELRTGLTRRLTPYGVADFSPAVSPSGVWTAVASYGEVGWGGEVEELGTDIYVFLSRDGSERVKAVEHGGWPCWVDDRTLFFHRRGSDGWWSVHRAVLPSEGPVTPETVVTHRVTPPGLHAFTPATSPGNKDFIAVATRRPGSDFRHVEIFDLVRGEFRELTRLVSPRTHHFNPFISPDSRRVGYHKCRGGANGPETSPHFLLENVRSPVPGLSLFRVDGSFPSFSPAGDRIAYVKFPGVYVVNRDGSGRREVYSGTAFSTAWDPVRAGVVYTSTGPTFATETTHVDIISIAADNADGPVVKKLTTNGKNNAFPALSPDGKWIVFRSGRSGHKNLYIMDAVEGEMGRLQRLTKGPWTDTMCAWSPDGEWIAFASDRSKPGSGSFELYLIHPNGTGLRKLVQSGLAGRTNHPYFSPDGQSLVFTSDYAGVSAEPISNPHHYQPYGEIFTIKLDGSNLRRLTHNSFEDGTPAWGPAYIRPRDVELPNYGARCEFEDCHWLNEIPRKGFAGSHPGSAIARPQCGGS
ncbi:uncharacterized protein LOC116187946 [Punica granatum]|uniref:Uncharacterized protein n=2 Tax=Punica granatum TaxID=22663 RepID=A0A2I0KEB6_PUNGR|nr:uncharacterized protein LOC116187946 [Punica granatum]PKI66858.1 hypothetical protein CRG98_012724 [Punica granatum]